MQTSESRTGVPGLLWTLTAAMSVVLLLLAAGCGQSGQESKALEGEEWLPELAAARKAFESAPPSVKHPVEQALRIVSAGRENRMAYIDAMPQLQRLAGSPQITAEQKQALETLIERLKSEVGGQRQSGL